MFSLYFILFSVMVLFAPFLSVSSSNWLMLWVFMEVCLFSFMPLLSGKKYSMMTESSMKYFLVQAAASMILVVAGVKLYMNMMIDSEYYWVIFSIAIFLKLGVFPVHFWVIPVMKGIKMYIIFFLLGPMKIIPLFLMYMHLGLTIFMKFFYLMFGLLSMIIGAVMGNNMSNFRAMIGCSSIVHSGWFLVSAMVGGLLVYFYLYILTMIFLLSSMMSTSLAQSFFMLSLSGLPPFLLFFGKFIVLTQMILQEISGIFILMVVLSALFSLNFYLKFSYTFLLESLNSKVTKNNLFSILFFFVLISGTGMLFLI